MQREMYERHAHSEGRALPAEDHVSARDAFVVAELEKARRSGGNVFRVAELSVGDGGLTRAILRGVAGVDLVGYEISPTRIDMVRQTVERLDNVAGSVRFVECNLDEPFADNEPQRVHAVVAMDIMEHVFDVFNFVASSAALLEMGGTLILRVPNIAYVKRRIELLRGQLPVTSSWFGPAGDFKAWRERYGWDGSHLHYFTDDSLRKLLKQYGLAVRWLGDPGARFEDVRKLAPGLLCGNLAIVAEKVRDVPTPSAAEVIARDDSLQRRIDDYVVSAQHHGMLLDHFTALTDAVPQLKKHRDWVEANRWGYGARAFHYMWWLIVNDIAGRQDSIDALEIGVFKGQTISLWSLIAKQLGCQLNVTAVSPFEGNFEIPQNRAVRWLRSKLDPQFNKAMSEGNLHQRADYLALNQKIFETFDLCFDDIEAIRGLSNDEAVIGKVEGRRYDLVYIDGDHSYEVASSDVRHYAPLVKVGGFCVVDDAACDLPGEGYFKGFEDVTRAIKIIPELGFDNVLNIGHNRVFQRRSS